MRNNIKLLLKLIIPYSIFIIVVSAIVFMIFSNIYKNDYLEQLYIDINRISSSIEKDINNIKLVLNILDSYMAADLTPYELGLSMTNVYDKRKEFFDILYGNTVPFSEGGTFLSVTHQYPTNYDQTSRPWYKGALSTNGIYISDPYIDFNTKKLLITFSKAVYTNGKLKGVFGIDFSSINTVNINISNINKDNISLITSEGLYMMHKDANNILKDNVTIFNNDEVFKGFEKYVNNPQSPIIINGNNWGCIRNIEGTSWALAVKGDLHSYNAMSKKILFVFILIVIFLLLMGLFLTSMVLLPLSSYLDIAITAIDNMSEGNFNYRIDKKILAKGNRAGDLGRAIDKMEANIGKLVYRIKKAIEAKLEENDYMVEDLSLSAEKDHNISKETRKAIDDIAERKDIAKARYFNILDRKTSDVGKLDSVKDEASNILKVKDFYQDTFYTYLFNNLSIDEFEGKNGEILSAEEFRNDLITCKDAKVYTDILCSAIKKMGLDKYKDIVTTYNKKLESLRNLGKLPTPQQIVDSIEQKRPIDLVTILENEVDMSK